LYEYVGRRKCTINQLLHLLVFDGDDLMTMDGDGDGDEDGMLMYGKDVEGPFFLNITCR